MMQQSSALSSTSTTTTNTAHDQLQNEIKTQLLTREGLYRLIPQAEYGRLKFSPYSLQHQQQQQNNSNNTGNSNSSSLPLVKISFTKFVVGQQHHRILNFDETNNVGYNNKLNGDHNHDHRNDNCCLNDEQDDDDDDLIINKNGSSDDFLQHHYHNNQSHHHHHNQHQMMIQERICFNSGRELFIYIFNGVQPSTSDSTKLLIDRKTYKSTSPTCHDFCTILDQQISLLLIGFSQGQIQLIDPYRTDINNFYNQDRLIDKSKVTCIRWLPKSKQEFLVSYSSGQLYLYREDLPCFNQTPTYQQIKCGDDFLIYQCKTRTIRNPIIKWSIGCNLNNNNNNTNNQSSINEFEFSPCGQYLAIVSQDGFLRVFQYEQKEIIGRMRSYFGGLLCLGWSPDSKFIVTGGEDDLITVWSLQDKRVIARGQGHKSWVNSVTFDPFMTQTKDDTDNIDDILEDDNKDSSTVIDKKQQQQQRNNNSDELLTNYRIGSVGQDTQICLWDLTDDIIRQSNVIIKSSRSRSTISSHQQQQTSSSLINNMDHNNKSTNNNNNNVSSTNSQSSSSCNNNNNNSNQSNNSNNNHHHHSSFFNSLKKGAHKKAGGFSLSSRSFLDHNSKNNKNHQQNNKKNSNDSNNISNNNNQNNSNNNKNDSSNNNNQNNNLSNNNNNQTSNNFSSSSSAANNYSNNNNINNNFSVCDSSKLLGTSLCPRIKEVPMLEPHVCKKISNERLTSLIFRKDCFVVANHDGKIMIFSRPNKTNFNSLKISSPNASMASDVNEMSISGGGGGGTIVGAGDDDDENESEHI